MSKNNQNVKSGLGAGTYGIVFGISTYAGPEHAICLNVSIQEKSTERKPMNIDHVLHTFSRTHSNFGGSNFVSFRVQQVSINGW